MGVTKCNLVTRGEGHDEELTGVERAMTLGR
jgi:hypothetical protein